MTGLPAPVSVQQHHQAGVVATPTRVRPEIQGLRAVAVLLVVLYHLWPGWVRGGFIGVDVFFVISGFLITGNLLREVQRTGRVSLADFWARRARRLLPAAFLVLATTALSIFFFVPRLMWQQFFKEVGAAGLYVENWSLARDAVDYLASSTAPSPVQHYWTLSAEEQFYIGWPLLVLVALTVAGVFRWRRSLTVSATLAAATLASLVISLWQTMHNPGVAYFSTYTRAWEFGAGALLACVAGSRTVRSRTRGTVLSWGGLLVIVCLSLVFSNETAMPGTAAVYVVAASLAVIVAGNSSHPWSSTRLLTWRPVTLIGDISYSIYLWHWPFLVILPYLIDRPPGFLARVLILVATVAAAWLTKIVVEDPVRITSRCHLRRPAVALGAATVTALMLATACGAAWWYQEREVRRSAVLARSLTDGAPACFGAAARNPRSPGCPNPDLENTLVPAVTAVVDDYPTYPECDEQMTRRPVRPCEFGPVDDPSVPHIAVIGDSHARALVPSLIELADKRVLSLDLFTSGGCIWAEGRPNIADKSLRDSCVSLKDTMQPLLLRTAREYQFIVTTAWTNKAAQPIEAPTQALRAAWKPIAEMKVPIVALRDNPSPGGAPEANPNNCLSRVDLERANELCELSREESLDRFVDPFAAAVRGTPGARLLDMTRFYCDDKECPVVIGGVNVYRDNNHVTVTYARTMAPYYHRAFLESGLLKRR